MKVIAHRGGRGFGTDNTLAAMEKAVRSGVRAIETDVRATADGALLICHDATVWGRLVRRSTFEEFRRHAPERPLLSEVLESLAGWVSFNLEIKEAPALDVGEMLEPFGISRDTLITSFDMDFIAEYKRLFPDTETGFLYRMPYGRDGKFERVREAGAHIVAPHFSSIDEALVHEAHAEGLEVYAWTVDDEHDVRKLHAWGVDAVITDRYLEVRDLIGRLEAGGGAGNG